jgi:hypothetical protein
MRASVIQGSFPHGLTRVAMPGASSRNTPHGVTVQVPPHLTTFQAAGGEALPGAVRQKMESFFGTGFGDVRVHVGPHVTAMGATAFTHGAHIHFAPGRWEPGSQRGIQLLVHELAHVVQQRAGRAMNPFGNGVAVVQDSRLEAEAERFARRAAMQPAPAPPPPPRPQHAVQRLRGIALNTYVEVDDHGRSWFGELVEVVDAKSYRVRVGGSNRTVVVREMDTSYHPAILAMAHGRGKRCAATLPPMNKETMVAQFATHGATEQAIVTAKAEMTAEATTCAETIAMFEYMATHATALGSAIATDLKRYPKVPPVLRDTFLQGVGAALTGLMGKKGLWEESARERVAAETLDPRTWFAEGRTAMVAKCTTARTRGLPLAPLLQLDSYNNEAKSYGRRAESWTIGPQIAQYLSRLPVAEPPTVGARFAFAGGTFRDISFNQIHNANALAIGETYLLEIASHQWEVGVSAVSGTDVTFSSVAKMV